MKVLTVVSHPRNDSFTFAVARRFEQGLKDAGHETEILDLYQIGFDPALREADEPDWSNEKKRYSSEVEAEIERMKRHEALAYIFPIWWYAMPAMLKGYIDRVWNYGFAYGSNRLNHRRILWLGLAGAPAEHFEKRQYDKMIAHHLNIGYAGYAGIENSKLELFYETLDAKPGHLEELLNQAYNLGLAFTEE
ncbi:NAD(P)H oxidoreductase [Paenibacillus sp. GCM10027628]|uniref:NAD(P)H oxidoreductase n=1 Tax=Paenibacillus sp. GCM10027628 TaxID=3273413 RepID=UPI00362A0A94